MAISLAVLDDAVSQIDFSRHKKYRGVSYGLSENNSLSVASPWWISTPVEHPTLANNLPTTGRLQQEIMECISTAPSEDWFIDLMHLAPILPHANQSKFFNDKPGPPHPDINTIVESLATHLEKFPPRSLTIRLLEGYATPPPPSPRPVDPKQDHSSSIVKAFLGNETIRRHAKFFYGNFSPTFQSDGLVGKMANLICPQIDFKVVEKVVKNILNAALGLADFLTPEFVEVLVKGVIGFLKIIQSWNHGKMFAINGQHLITGGFNYWDEYIAIPETKYATTNENPPHLSDPRIFDISMKITGEAAVQAHQFADYFWRYLNQRPCTDESSWSFGREPGTGTELRRMRASIFQQTEMQHVGNTKAFFVGKSGNWPRDRIGFPAQIFDAVRDFVMNVLVVIAERQSIRSPDLALKIIQNLSDDSPHFAAILKEVDVSPSAWASKYARNFAVANAEKSVRLSQQAIAEYKFPPNQDYDKIVSDINYYIQHKIAVDPGKEAIYWDGGFRNFHLYLSLAHALSNIGRNPVPTDGVSVILTSIKPNDFYYHRANTDIEFKASLKALMVQMKSSGGIPENQDVESLLQSFVMVNIDQDALYNEGEPGKFYNHSKLVVVDDSVCYIGSDNAYPSYLTEFGLWIDDRDSIQRFINEYWTPLWEHLTRN